MANSNNVFSSEKPLEGNVSDWISGQEQMDFRYRAEAREIAKIKQNQKDKEQASYEKRLEKFKLPEFKPTGIKPTDEVMAKVMLKAVDLQGEIYKKLKPGISNEEYASLVMQQKNLDNLPEYLDLSQKAFVNEATSIQKQLTDGTIKNTPELQKKLSSFSQGYFDLELDENAMPMLGLWDKDGDGKPDILPYDKIVSQSIFGTTVPNVDFTSAFQKLGEKLGSEKKTTDVNFVKRTIKETPIALAKMTAKGALYDDKGNFSPIAKSRLYDMGITDFDNVPDTALQKLEKDATEIMLATRDKEDVTDIDYSGINAANKEARISRENKEKASSGKKNEANLSDLTLTANERTNTLDKDGNVIKTGDAESNVYQGNINISRKVGSTEEKFRSFSIGKNGIVKVKVDASEKDLSGNGKITPKVYTSDQNADEVNYFVQRFKDPKTGKYLKNIKDLRSKISEMGDSSADTTVKKSASSYGL